MENSNENKVEKANKNNKKINNAENEKITKSKQTIENEKVIKKEQSIEVANEHDIASVEVDNNQESKIKKNKKTYIVNILIIIAIFIALIIYIFAHDGIETIREILNKADYKWLAAGFGCLLLVWTSESFCLHIPLKKIYPDQKFSNSVKINMIGQLFNNLTPFATGGQVMQVYIMNKEGKRTSDSISVLTMKFVITQGMLIVFSIIMIIAQFGYLKTIFNNAFAWIAGIGIILNIACVGLFVLAALNKNFVMKIARPIIKFLHNKIHFGKHQLFKDVDATISKFDESVENFNNQFKFVAKNKTTIILMAIIGLMQNIIYYMITYTVYKTFGNEGTSVMQIITIQAVLMLIMTVFPTPGAGLGAEGGFLILFNSIFKNGTINLSILFWRIYIFYLPIIVGALFFIPTWRKEKKINERNTLSGRDKQIN